MKRAIAIGGGGPAVGLGLGVLKTLEEAGIGFQVWSLSCIGAWLGAAYNCAPAGASGYAVARAAFSAVVRPDAVARHFPTPPPFAPDFGAMGRHMAAHLAAPATWQDLFLPRQWGAAAERLGALARDPAQWTPARLNSALLNDVLALHPASRLLSSLLYRAPITGLARLHYAGREGGTFGLPLGRLFEPGRPRLYHNAYNLTDRRLELFVNATDHPRYAPMSEDSLLAGSALPYILEPVALGDKLYCEGATVDTVNFRDLLDNHPDLEEIWVVRLLSRKQIRPPTSLTEALNNLIMLFAAAGSEDAVTLLRFGLEQRRSRVRVVELPVEGEILYEWTEANLEQGILAGEASTRRVLADYRPAVSFSADHRAGEALQDRGGPAELADRLAGPAPADAAGALLEALCALPGFLEVARAAAEGAEVAADLAARRGTVEASWRAGLRALESDVVARLTAAGLERVHALTAALEAVRSLAGDLDELVALARQQADLPAIAADLAVVLEAVDAMVAVAVEAAQSADLAEIALARNVTTHRGESLRAFRARSASRRRGLQPRAAAALLQATSLVERSAHALDELLRHLALLLAMPARRRRKRGRRP